MQISILIYLIVVLGSFYVAVYFCGKKLDETLPYDEMMKIVRVIHSFFYICLLLLPSGIAIYPGVLKLDRVFGLPSFDQFKPFNNILGLILFFSGLIIIFVARRALKKYGEGSPAFLLTKHLVNISIYRYTRNPMSLGFYLLFLGGGTFFGSTFVILASVFGIIPCHIFYLKFFEEKEVTLRMGEEFLGYKVKTPFLIPCIL